jgi:16S rRNA (guanine1207-N2)-methyltransferase
VTTTRPTDRPAPTGRFDAEFGDDTVAVRGRPGFPDWDVVTDAMRLVAERVTCPPGGHLLAWGTGHGALPAALLSREATARATIASTNLVAREASAGTIAANHLEDRAAPLSYPRDVVPGEVDLVVLLPLQNRDLNRRILLESVAALRDGGRLAIAGPNGGGIRTTISDAVALLGTPREEVSRMKQRLAVFSAPSRAGSTPEWASEPGVSPGTWRPYPVMLGDERLELVTLPGVFSDDGLDAGTAMLLGNLPQVTGRRVLDLGCGSGLLGIAAARAGAASVTMTDVDLLAVASARENIARSGVVNASAVASDLYASIRDQRFDVVLSNPPFHAGQRVDRDIAEGIVRDAPAVLDAGGEIVLVANRFLAYDRALRATFGGFERVASDEHYHVLRATRPAVVEADEVSVDEAAAAAARTDDPGHYLITDELRRRFPVIDGGATANAPRPPKPVVRRRTSRSIRRGPGRNKK